jgi:hypothetical protein
MKKECKERVSYLLNEITSPKSALIRIESELQDLGAARLAEQLGKIILRLEAFQNKPIK